MSTTIFPTHRPSVPLFAQLVQRLRHTNARYIQIAHQCRRTQHPTYHAKRRAYCAGLRIDTSKACHAWQWEGGITPVPVPALVSATSRIDVDDGVWAVTSTEIEAEMGREKGPRTARAGQALENYDLDLWMHAPTLSPLDLEFDSNSGSGSGSGLNGYGPVPGAPRWRSVPLPETEPESESECPLMDIESTTHGSGDVMDTRLSQMEVGHVGPGLGLGITVLSRDLKRKLRNTGLEDGCYGITFYDGSYLGAVGPRVGF